MRSPTNESEARATANVRAVIEGYVRAWQRGDRVAILNSYHDEFTLHYFGHSALAGIHRGKQRAIEVLMEFSRLTQRRLVEIVATMAGPERGAVIARERFGDDQDFVELDRLLVYSIADAKLRECWVYDGDPALVDRFLQKRVNL